MQTNPPIIDEHESLLQLCSGSSTKPYISEEPTLFLYNSQYPYVGNQRLDSLVGESRGVVNTTLPYRTPTRG